MKIKFPNVRFTVKTVSVTPPRITGHYHCTTQADRDVGSRERFKTVPAGNRTKYTETKYIGQNILDKRYFDKISETKYIMTKYIETKDMKTIYIKTIYIMTKYITPIYMTNNYDNKLSIKYITTITC